VGLALDESEDTKDFLFNNNGIDILVDKDMKRYIDTGAPVTVNYQETPYGAGFFIENGSRCG